jgi:hypothetical protein
MKPVVENSPGWSVSFTDAAVPSVRLIIDHRACLRVNQARPADLSSAPNSDSFDASASLEPTTRTTLDRSLPPVEAVRAARDSE